MAIMFCPALPVCLFLLLKKTWEKRKNATIAGVKISLSMILASLCTVYLHLSSFLDIIDTHVEASVPVTPFIVPASRSFKLS